MHSRDAAASRRILNQIRSAAKSLKSLEDSIGTKGRTPEQDRAGAENLARYRQSHAASPRLKSGVSRFLRSGRIPAGVKGAEELTAYVEEMLVQMIRERGVTKAQLSAEQRGTLNDQRRVLTALGLLNKFLFRGCEISASEERLLKSLHVRARRNFVKFQSCDRFDAMLVEFVNYLYEGVPRSRDKNAN